MYRLISYLLLLYISINNNASWGASPSDLSSVKTCELWAHAAYTPQEPQIIFHRRSQDTVGLYQKLEISLDIKAVYNNPFDPADIDVQALFTAPSGKTWTIMGFYNYTTWQAVWMIRFAAQETGTWRYQITVRDKNGTAAYPEQKFQVIPSAKHGPVTIAPNRRFLQHHNGESYYGVGLWYNDQYAAFNQGRITPAELDQLKNLGVNYISTFITPLETHGTGLGRYDQNLCGRLDEVLSLCEERDIQLSLNLWFHAYLSETVWPGGNRRWNTNPYQQICAAKDFYRSEQAWAYQEKLYRYCIARWGYSPSLLLWFIVDEVNGTDGWVSGDSLVAAEWGKKVHQYFKQNDPYQHLTTGTRSGGINEFWHQGYQIFDLSNREIYEAQGFPINRWGRLDSASVHPLTQSYRNYAGQVDKLWQGYYKPAIIGETGWDHTFYEPAMPGYQAMYHNALWVSLASGTAMSPFWWAHSTYLNDNIVTQQLRHLRHFTEAIPFARLSGVVPIKSSQGNTDIYAIYARELIYGWMAESTGDVSGDQVLLNLPSQNSPLPSSYKLRIYHTWRGAFIHEEVVTIQNGRITFTLPTLKIDGGRSYYLGQDMAFILEPIN